MHKNFTKDEKKFSLLLKKICFHCLNHVFGESEWKERDPGNEKFMPKIIGKSFLEKYDHTLLSEKENELLEILGTKILMN